MPWQDRSVLHAERLAGVLKHIPPKAAFDVDMASLGHGLLDWQVDELVVHAADQTSGLSRHGRMHRMGAKTCAVDRVVAVGRGRADDVRRVDVLDRCRDALVLEILLDPLLEEDADVVVLDVARGIGLACGRRELLACTLRDEDYRVSTFQNPPLEVLQKAVGAIEIERTLRDETEVDIRLGQGRMCGDEAGFAAHDLHQADAVGCR